MLLEKLLSKLWVWKGYIFFINYIYILGLLVMLTGQRRNGPLDFSLWALVMLSFTRRFGPRFLKVSGPKACCLLICVVPFMLRGNFWLGQTFKLTKKKSNIVYPFWPFDILISLLLLCFSLIHELMVLKT